MALPYKKQLSDPLTYFDFQSEDAVCFLVCHLFISSHQQFNNNNNNIEATVVP